MKKLLKNYFNWLVLNGIAGYALWAVGFGPLRENAGCVSIFKFTCWLWVGITLFFTLLITIMGALAKRKPKGSEIPKRWQRVPMIVSVVYDIAFTGALAYLGWTWLAAAWFIHMLAQCWAGISLEAMRQIEEGEREPNI